MPENNTLYAILIVAVIGLAIFIYIQLRERKNKALAETGADKAHLKQVVEKLLPGEMGYRTLYGHWEDVQHMGRTTRTTYYSYALAFDAERLWIAPLKFQQGSILPAQPVLVTREDLGRADTDVTTAKDGGIRRINVVLYDKSGKEIVRFNADAENLREDRFHHVNILQEEECGHFARFMNTLSGQVLQENQDLVERMKAEANAGSGKTATILAVIGIFVGCLLPICGIALGVIGLLMAPKPKETLGKSTRPRILCMVTIALSILAAIFQALIAAGII